MAIAPALGIAIGGADADSLVARDAYLIAGFGLTALVAFGWLTGALSPSHSRQDRDLAPIVDPSGEPV